MRLSEFRTAVSAEFGEGYGPIVVRDVVMTELGSRSAEQAIEAGVPVADAWEALCREMDVPPERWHGRGLPKK
nr:DUF3046 domain-containing protein [Lysinibacter cavernae]